jgi:ubiquinone/menaquinone biosynthesis C-methylase UbiE
MVSSSKSVLSSSSTTLGSTTVPAGTEKDDPAKTSKARELAVQKEKLLGLLSMTPPKITETMDKILVDPLTKESLTISTAAKSSSSSTSPSTGLLLGGTSSGASTRSNSRGVSLKLKSASNSYTGNTQGFYDLLEPVKDSSSSAGAGAEENEMASRLTMMRQAIVRNVVPFIPPPLRAMASATGLDSEYIPMRDLFTSPSVSFAYERGWRQSFSQAGFPGPEKEAAMAMDYFQPAFDSDNDSNTSGVLVDMSCATGLFTRRFAKSGRYKRVLGCDYSASMLTEARNRIQADDKLSSSSLTSLGTQLELIRCDVGQIALQDASITALHAGAAMHCWPDLPRAVTEIHRVLKPGGRYFASTFLSSYFRMLQLNGSGSNSDSILNPAAGVASQEVFQYFQSTDQLRSLMEQGGFSPDKISIEVLGTACVVIRCEK